MNDRKVVFSNNGRNRRSFVRPKKGELVPGAREQLRKLLLDEETMIDNIHLVITEQTTVLAFKDGSEDEKFLNDTIPNWNESRHDLVEGDEMACHLVESVHGHHILIVSSFFIVFAERVSIKCMFHCVKAFSTTSELLVAVGGKGWENARCHMAELTSYLMACEKLKMDNAKDEGNFCLAHWMAMPNGFFECPVTRCSGVYAFSRKLGIGYAGHCSFPISLARIVLQMPQLPVSLYW